MNKPGESVFITFGQRDADGHKLNSIDLVWHGFDNGGANAFQIALLENLTKTVGCLGEAKNPGQAKRLEELRHTIEHC